MTEQLIQLSTDERLTLVENKLDRILAIMESVGQVLDAAKAHPMVGQFIVPPAR